MYTAVKMDQQQFAQPSSSGSQSNVGGHSELPPDISQMDFQTIKAASETLKVSSTEIGRKTFFE